MNDNRKVFIKGALLGALVVCIIGACGFLVWQESLIIDMESQSKLKEIESVIDQYALYDVDEELMEEYAIRGYVAGTEDPYTVYYSEEEASDLLDSIAGEYSGIGALLSQNIETGEIIVMNVYPDTPAKESGLQEGDIIDTVEGNSVTREDLTNVVTEIKGEEGTFVNLGIIRGEEREAIEIKVERRIIETPTVSYEMKEDNVGYLQIVQFDGVTYNQFVEAIEALQKEGMERLVIDLRNNPGGNLDTVCQMLELLLPEGSTIVSMKDKYGTEEVLKSEGEPVLDIPFVLLVNEYSASASEIFAGAVKDYELGDIVGATTYGKGLVQQTIGLSDGSILKVTISEYFSPTGKEINEVGVEPDYVVEENVDEEGNDLQLEKALEILRGK